jgi:beta-RFAP synthase
LYGGLGIAIDRPQLEVIAEKSDTFSLLCHDSEHERTSRMACEYLRFYGLPGVRIEVVQSLPQHSGLGSGTTLALALGFAITRVYGLSPPVAELAVVTDREGSRSGIGVAAFEQGGFLLDGGKRINLASSDRGPVIPPLLVRVPFPDEWAIVLALPHGKKIFGTAEENAFQSLPPMDREVSGALCRLVVMKLLPGLVEKDLESFGQAVTAIQECVGCYFAPVQGGPYASAQAARIADYLVSQGAVGVGQSSWGPLIYGFTRKGDQPGLLEKIQGYVGNDGLVWTASGRNQGASWGWR